MCLLGAFTCWILFDYDTACFISSNYWFYWVVILAFPIVAALMACSDKLMKTSPLNIICLVIFSVMMAFMFAFLAGLWSTAGSNCGYYTFCGYFFLFFCDLYSCIIYRAADSDCRGKGNGSDYCVQAELCIQDAFCKWKANSRVTVQHFSGHRSGWSRYSVDLLFEPYSHTLRLR